MDKTHIYNEKNKITWRDFPAERKKEGATEARKTMGAQEEQKQSRVQQYDDK